jgi:hypothetical protein
MDYEAYVMSDRIEQSNWKNSKVGSSVKCAEQSHETKRLKKTN